MTIPLAEQLRPKILDDVVGQEHLLNETGFLTRTIKSKKPLSILLWGPPGCGKTSLARLYARAFDLRFVTFSAIFHGINDLRKLVKQIVENPLLERGTLLFVDEIHRFNKAQQDAFLPYIEDGTFVLIGATTENPSFYLNGALLSRLTVLPVNPLSEYALDTLLQRYEKRFKSLALDESARALVLNLAQGDGRYLFNIIEILCTITGDEPLTVEVVSDLVQKRAALFDKQGEHHYNLISALHKSIRGSDPDATLYWMARMFEGGEDPRFIARRLIRMASEDIGLADPQALTLAVSAKDSYEMLGSPEGELALAEVALYLALAPKSNAVYTAYKKAQQLAKETTHLPPPAIILNAPTKLMKTMGYGQGYLYDHDQPHGFSGQNYFPKELERPKIYSPVERGFERDMQKRINFFERLRLLRLRSVNSL